MTRFRLPPRNRRRAFFAGLALIAASFAAGAVGKAAPPPPAAEPQTGEDASPFAAKTATPPMWIVKDKDSEIYLLGSFHILPRDLVWHTDYIDRAFKAADAIWFEAELDTPEARQRITQIVMTDGFNKGGAKLSDTLSKEDGALLNKIVAEVGLPMKAVDVMRPWYAFLAISVQFIASKGFDPDAGVEATLLSEARAAHKNLHFFETADQQLGLFTSLPSETEKKLLTVTLEDWEEQTSELGKLYTAWRTGDVRAIDALMNESMRDEAPSVFAVLVTNRNAAWADKIAKEMSGSGKELIVIGAAHLVGKNSVPALLAAKGFDVERYKPSAAP
ncbi:MAG TPA: TraB/GumN family protein [Parvularculaceae bacterium]|nr:TraB/GumN family protein [Parvularculaceae bacterium]